MHSPCAAHSDACRARNRTNSPRQFHRRPDCAISFAIDVTALPASRAVRPAPSRTRELAEAGVGLPRALGRDDSLAAVVGGGGVAAAVAAALASVACRVAGAAGRRINVSVRPRRAGVLFSAAPVRARGPQDGRRRGGFHRPAVHPGLSAGGVEGSVPRAVWRPARAGGHHPTTSAFLLQPTVAAVLVRAFRTLPSGRGGGSRWLAAAGPRWHRPRHRLRVASGGVGGWACAAAQGRTLAPRRRARAIPGATPGRQR